MAGYMAQIDPRIVRFVDDIVLPRRGPAVGVPSALRLDPNNRDEWSDWIAIDSTIDESDLLDLQSELHITLPSLYLDYFRYKQIYDGDQGIVRLPDMKPPDPLADLRNTISVYQEHFAGTKRERYVAFADDGNDGGPLCFNLDEPTPGDDFAVYFVDHELLRDASYVGERRYDGFASVLVAIEKDRLSYDEDCG
ncbi:MAG: SMI1/KNR4 family protein [Pirellula sp.]|jgi:hypothetical protein|nr:SMI1/KNR4 family protein [Pirellula sp.]